MATSLEDLVGHLERLGRRYERLESDTLLIAFGPGQPPAALRVAPPVAVLQVEIGPCPSGDDAAPFFRRLLELNASDLLHAAYAIENSPEGGRVVLTSALELSHLDSNELEAVLADLDVALVEHVPTLRKLASAPTVAPKEPQG